jgi:hypothetical protein
MTNEVQFVFRIGPIPVKDGTVLAFFVDPGRDDARTFVADDERSGLELVARAYGGARLECEPELALSAAPFGFVPGPITDERKHYIGLAAFDLVFGDLLRGIEHDAITFQFGRAASAFWQAAPWQHASVRNPIDLAFEGTAPGRFEAMVMGGEVKLGLTLYPQQGTLERLSALAAEGRLDEAARVDSLSTTFEDEPAYAVDAMRRAYELRRLPVPARMAQGSGVRPSDHDLLRLAAALKATSLLNDEARASTTAITIDDLSIRVTARLTTRTQE